MANKAIGTVRSSDFNFRGDAVRCSSGNGMTMTKAGGLGRVMIADLENAIRTAKQQYKEDRIAAARDRLANRSEYSHLSCRY